MRPIGKSSSLPVHFPAGKTRSRGKTSRGKRRGIIAKTHVAAQNAALGLGNRRGRRGKRARKDSIKERDAMPTRVGRSGFRKVRIIRRRESDIEKRRETR